MGSKISTRNGSKLRFSEKKVVKKQLFWGTQIRINWLWGGLTPIFLKVSLFSACVLKNLEHDLRTELCARRQSSIVSDWRPLENYFESDTEKCKKQLFLGTKIRINWLWGGLRPIFLKVSLTSACVLKNLEHCLRNELWARRQSLIVSDWRPLENYFECCIKNCKKRFFLVFLKLLEILI